MTVAVGFIPRITPARRVGVAERRLKPPTEFKRRSATRARAFTRNRGMNPTATIIPSLRDAHHACKEASGNAKRNPGLEDTIPLGLPSR